MLIAWSIYNLYNIEGLAAPKPKYHEVNLTKTMETGKIKQKITRFYQDEVGDWVAVLSCRHQRHVRHNPPWTNHPWVVTPAGRQRFIGVEIECKACNEEQSQKVP